MLEWLNIDPEAWLDTAQNYNKNYYCVVSSREWSLLFKSTSKYTPEVALDANIVNKTE